LRGLPTSSMSRSLKKPGPTSSTARARNHRFWRLSALRAHTKAPYKTDLHRKTLMTLNRPGTARTEGAVVGGVQQPQHLYNTTPRDL
jgi:hypothetical protein